MLPAHEFAVLQIKIEAPYKRPVAAGLEYEATINVDRVLHAVMGMAADDHIYARHILGKLHVLREPDVGENDQQIDKRAYLRDVSMKFPDAGLEAQPLAEVGWHGLVSKIGRASCRGGVCQYGEISGVDGK